MQNNIQWFPGHMKKAERMVIQNLKLVDGVLELLDARIPYSSQCEHIEKLIDKPKLLILTKSDCADPSATEKWLKFYKSKKVTALPIDSKTGKGVGAILPTLKNNVLAELVARRKERRLSQPLRLMVVGIPNVGKSAFINRMTGSKSAKVEDKPGVTRNKQWIKLANDVEFLDTPGILTPKYEDQEVAKKLAFVGSIRDEILDIEGLAFSLLEQLNKSYNSELENHYKSKIAHNLEGHKILNLIGNKRGLLIKGGEIDTERTAIMVLDEFRGAKIGRISLETPIL